VSAISGLRRPVAVVSAAANRRILHLGVRLL